MAGKKAGEGEAATDAPKRPEIRFDISERVWKYLDWLSRHSVLGESANEVAESVLIARLAEMRAEDYKPPEKL
jgi:hypothetical protein